MSKTRCTVDKGVVLLSRPRAVVGSQAAGHLHGFAGFGRCRPVIVVPGSSNARSEIAGVIRAEHHEELEVVQVRGSPATSIPETLITLVGEMTPVRFERLFDHFILAGRVVLEDVERLADREQGRRRRGIAHLRELLEDRKPIGHPLSINCRACRIDVSIPEWGLVIEADGRNWHSRQADFEQDRRRDNELAMRGIQVVRLTYRMLKSDPEGCLETIRPVGRVRSA